jgi:SAM-dependent methyltransferase
MISESPLYPENFYTEYQSMILASAQLIVPWIISLLSPKSVIDVGCGTGTWLSVFEEHGVSNIFGIDGGWVPKDRLEISREHFQVMDLRQPIGIPNKFDLVLSLEVAEHLPAADADRFIAYLTSLGPVILFSAAIPGQGGDNHLNEQWPAYWIALFEKNDFCCIDCVRGKFWTNEKVACYYAQNAFFFVAKNRVNHYPILKQEENMQSFRQERIIHPAIFKIKVDDIEWFQDPRSYSIRNFVKVFPFLFKQAVLLRIGKYLKMLRD